MDSLAYIILPLALATGPSAHAADVRIAPAHFRQLHASSHRLSLPALSGDPLRSLTNISDIDIRDGVVYKYVVMF